MGGGYLISFPHLQLSGPFRVYVAEQSKKQEVSLQHRASPHIFTLARQWLATTGKLAYPLVLAELAFWAPSLYLPSWRYVQGSPLPLLLAELTAANLPGRGTKIQRLK